MAPILDLARFAPNDLGNGNWEKVTKVVDDCNMKNCSSGTELSTVGLKAAMMNAGAHANFIKIYIGRYVDEVQKELLCIMTDSARWDGTGQCEHHRADHNLSEGESSSCWVDYYNSMDDFYAFDTNYILDRIYCKEVPTSFVDFLAKWDLMTFIHFSYEFNKFYSWLIIFSFFSKLILLKNNKTIYIYLMKIFFIKKLHRINYFKDKRDFW